MSSEYLRIEDFQEGDVTCVCGRTFHMHFNGGELDQHYCRCGLRWSTEIQQVDLIAYGECYQPSTLNTKIR